MRLIDVLTQKYREALEKGLRPCGLKLDAQAQVQLAREAQQDGMAVASVDGISTFMKLPIETHGGGDAEMLFVRPSQRFIAWNRRDRDHDRTWDLFDLDQGKLMGVFSSTKAEATTHLETLQREL